jgi:hypothetical protein
MRHDVSQPSESTESGAGPTCAFPWAIGATPDTEQREALDAEARPVRPK